MIVCSSCNHQNPDGALQCEACYSPLPSMTSCPSCGASVQTDAVFCGQCGNPLKSKVVAASGTISGDLGGDAGEVPQVTPAEASPIPSQIPVAPVALGVTQLQVQAASLLHLQTQTKIEIPQGLSVIHIGKPNDQIPPDIDVSGFPNSDVVSRIHADLRVEGDTFYIEDVGSANGTYINHTPLSKGNRHRLRSGDRISLGKGDLVTFIFQLT